MTQAPLGPVEDSVGYALKQTAAALRSAMEAVLRPHELTVPQYACLELLKQHPELSNAELARGMFVSRQSMNGVLQGLEERGLVTRPTSAARGRALPASLTAQGRRRLDAASGAVRAVEARMLAPLGAVEERRLLDALAACRRGLDEG